MGSLDRSLTCKSSMHFNVIIVLHTMLPCLSGTGPWHTHGQTVPGSTTKLYLSFAQTEANPSSVISRHRRLSSSSLTLHTFLTFAYGGDQVELKNNTETSTSPPLQESTMASDTFGNGTTTRHSTNAPFNSFGTRWMRRCCQVA